MEEEHAIALWEGRPNLRSVSTTSSPQRWFTTTSPGPRRVTKTSEELTNSTMTLYVSFGVLGISGTWPGHCAALLTPLSLKATTRAPGTLFARVSPSRPGSVRTCGFPKTSRPRPVIAHTAQDPVSATLLLSAADHIRTRINIPLQRAERPSQQSLVQDLRGHLNGEKFEQAWRDGSHLTIDEAIALGKRCCSCE
jgi:hypothetical protein